MAEPPRFQEASRCDVCKCSFNTFRRRHHCRCCGRTLCNEHSSNQMMLPQFGINYNVRVCYDCFNNSTRDVRPEQDPPSTSKEVLDATSDAFSDLDIKGNDAVPTETVSTESTASISECKCGMPLCICQVSQSTDPTVPKQEVPTPNCTAQPTLKPKKLLTKPTVDSAPKDVTSSVNRASSFFSLGQSLNGNMDKLDRAYEKDGEGLRQAIKNNDIVAVKHLLSEGVDANYCDKQGMSLLHLAALFNRTEIVFLLMDQGARTDYKNAQGETPLDCAPTMLQYKMRENLAGGK